MHSRSEADDEVVVLGESPFTQPPLFQLRGILHAPRQFEGRRVRLEHAQDTTTLARLHEISLRGLSLRSGEKRHEANAVVLPRRVDELWVGVERQQPLPGCSAGGIVGGAREPLGSVSARPVGCLRLVQQELR